MNFSQMKDERLLLFSKPFVSKSFWMATAVTASPAKASAPMPTSSGKNWTGDGLVSRRLIGHAHDGRPVEVPIQVRELAVNGIDNAEKALALFFDNVPKSIAPNATKSVALIKRVIAVKMDYARKIARASDLTEATALQFAYCRSQVEITADLIRIISDASD